MRPTVHLTRRALVLWLSVFVCVPVSFAVDHVDPLPSWNEGPTKMAILDAIRAMTTHGDPRYVEPVDRIATFDNDGTLWCEKPVIQGMFVLERLKEMVAVDPSVRDKPGVQQAIDGDLAYFKQAGEEAVLALLALTHGNMSDTAFTEDAERFFATAEHPELHRPYTQLTYVPMVELLKYLRSKGFETFISSGGTVDFMRVISEPLYGIKSEQVIGSHLAKEFVEKDGKWLLWRLPEIASINDKETKPVGISSHIGKQPVFVAGNVRTGGDIAMMRYSRARAGYSFQILVNHDDAEREFAYSEPNDYSLKAAAQSGFQVVSMAKDWRVIFAPPVSPK